MGLLAVGLLLASCGDSGQDSTASNESQTETTNAQDTGSEQNADLEEKTATVEQAEAVEETQDSLLVDEFATLAAATIDLADLEGEDVVLWFWAPW